MLTENAAAPGASMAPRLTFSKAERLCARRLIEPLFKGGQAFNTYPLRLVYGRVVAGTAVSDKPNEPVQVLFSVSKRHFKRAHDRNRVKRLLREAWRHERAELLASLPAPQPLAPAPGLLVAVLYIGRELPDSLLTVQRRLRKALARLRSELSPPIPPSAS